MNQVKKPPRIWTVGCARIYDEVAARGPHALWKGGRDERGPGGTVFRRREAAEEVAEGATRDQGELYCVYIIEAYDVDAVVWNNEGVGELIADAKIERKECVMDEENKLYKRVLVIWSSEDIREMTMEEVGRTADRGMAVCSRDTETVLSHADAQRDPDWSNTVHNFLELMGVEVEGAKEEEAEKLDGLPYKRWDVQVAGTVWHETTVRARTAEEALKLAEEDEGSDWEECAGGWEPVKGTYEICDGSPYEDEEDEEE